MKNKEIRRVELAIKSNNKEEILWAVSYFKVRLQIASTAYLRKQYEKRIRELSSLID